MGPTVLPAAEAAPTGRRRHARSEAWRSGELFLQPGVTGVAAGGLHSLAVKGDGRVMAWGWDYFGQGTGFDHPVDTGDLDHAAAIAAGAYHTLFAYRLAT